MMTPTTHQSLNQRIRILVALCLGVTLLHCTGATQVCAPGETQACQCSASQQGVQTCIASGSSWGTCLCDKPPVDGGQGGTQDAPPIAEKAPPTPQKNFCDFNAEAMAGTYELLIREGGGGRLVEEIVIVITKDGKVTADSKSTQRVDDLRCDTKNTKLCSLEMLCSDSSNTPRYKITFERSEKPTSGGNLFCALQAGGLTGSMKWVLSDPGNPKNKVEMSLNVDAKGSADATIRNYYDGANQRTEKWRCVNESQKLCDFRMLCSSTEGRSSFTVQFRKR